METALKGYGVDIFITSNWYEFLDTSTDTAKSSMYSDYLHPTQDGYYAMVENFFDAIRALFNPDYIQERQLPAQDTRLLEPVETTRARQKGGHYFAHPPGQPSLGAAGLSFPGNPQVFV